MATKTMSKKRNQRPERPQIEKLEQASVPVPKRYSPPACNACVTYRSEGLNYTEVYSVKREAEHIIRYCKCKFCGHTFKDSQKDI